MKKFNDIVKEVSGIFLEEAKKSPQLISDMAKMEYYMAESYSGRLFIELLQNADDAKSTRIISYYNNGNLYFANNGKPFDQNDLISISRSGSSGKQRGETIGYRGIGFKSASSISNEIIIYSADTYFTFSREKCANILGMKLDEVPTIRIPIHLETVEEEISKDIDMLKNEGYSTIFVLKKVDIHNFVEELNDINQGLFMFLNNICECTFDINGFKDLYVINRYSKLRNEHVEIRSMNVNNEWMIVKSKSASVAFLIENGIIVPCDHLESLYHCYLPTLEKSIISCKINADFSTDPSRKHITIDSKTQDSLEQIANIFSQVLETAFSDADTGKYKNIVNMYINKTTTSKINFYLDEIIEKNIHSKKWIKLSNGDLITPNEYKTFPQTFELECVESIRAIKGKISDMSLPKSVYENIDEVESFMNQYSYEKIRLDTIVEDLSNIEYVKQLNEEEHIQLLTNVIRESKMEKVLNSSKFTDLKQLMVKSDNDRYETIDDVVSRNESLHSSLKQELNERLADTEINWMQSQICSSDLIKNNQNNKPSFDNIECKVNSVATFDTHISKWRDAENKCVLIEEKMGHRATDVSLKNYGYDVESVTKDGKTRYIEVKSVKKDFSFSLTNNEYTAAHQYKEDYYICLMLEDDNKLEVRYIQDPLNNAKFEKRIKQWEWLCLEWDATLMTFELKN